MKFNLYLFEYINIIAMLVLLFNYRKLNAEAKSYLAFLSIVITFETLIVRHFDNLGHNTDYIFAIYATLFCATFYNLVLLMKMRNHRLFKFFIISVILWEMINLYLIIFQKDYIGINAVSYTFGIAIFVMMFFVYCYAHIFRNTYTNIWSDPVIWLGIGISIMYVACFTTFIFLNNFYSISAIKKQSRLIIEIGNFLLSCGYLMAAISLTPLSRFVFPEKKFSKNLV